MLGIYSKIMDVKLFDYICMFHTCVNNVLNNDAITFFTDQIIPFSLLLAMNRNHMSNVLKYKCDPSTDYFVFY